MPDLKKLHNLAGALRDRVQKQEVEAERPNRWYNISNRGATAELYIYNEIGEYGVSAADMIGELKAVTAKKIELHLNSEGGEVFDGIAIYEALKQHPAKVRTMVDSLAASAASFIAMAADPYDEAADTGGVFMARNARLMIHDAACGGGAVFGNAATMREFIRDVEAVADLLDDMSDNIADIYAARAGGTVEQWRGLMSAETWFSAQQAIEAKLVDGVIGESKQEDTPSAVPAEEDVKDELTLDFEALAQALKGAWDGV